MNITVYFALAIAASFMALYIKQIRADFALLITLAAVLFLFSGIVPRIVLLVNDIQTISTAGGITSDYIGIILKIIGISYICEISSNLCLDAGERALSNHVELIGKIAIAFIALPVVEEVFSMITGLLG